MPDKNLKVVGTVKDATYAQRLEEEARKRERGIYPRTILIGIGGTGAKSLLHLRRVIMERFGTVNALEAVAYLSIDTDVRSQEVAADEERKSPLDQALAFEKDERVNIQIDFKKYVGPNIIHHPHIREWWDENALPSADFNIEAGAGQIRPLSRLAFFTNKSAILEAVRRAYRKVTTQHGSGNRVDVDSPVRVVIVAGLAGGTGSGMVLDLPALVAAELSAHERPVIEGFFVLPGGFSGVERAENYPKLAANGFSSLLELNHYLSHPFEVRWEANATTQDFRGLYNRQVLFSGTNASGEQLKDLSDCYRTIGETLFLDFGAGPMAGWIQGVRVNREQYLNSAVVYTYRLPQADGTVRETHTDEWRNAFASIGISKLVFPSWRLINKAKYELAGEMVGLLDPGRLGKLSDVITNYRNRFMFDCNFFQGSRESDGGLRSHWQIRDRLARQSGAGKEITSVYEHIQKFQNELIDLAESMYTEGNTVEESEAVWKRLASLWGDPTSLGQEGDWARYVVDNRRNYVKEVEVELPQVVESFRNLPAVGISGVVALLRDILETFDRPADQEFRYTDYFKQQRQKLDTQISNSRELWKRRVVAADESSRGFGRNPDNHKKAVSLAAEALAEHWRARVNDFICQEGVTAIAAIKQIVQAQLTKLEQIADRMSALESEYRQLAAFYATPQQSFVLQEIDVATDGDLLAPYLGTQPDERQEKLVRLLDRGLRRMGLTTLEAIGDKLASEYEKFRDNLSAQAFYALRGENGETTAFSDDPEDREVAFIERYSIFKVLRDNMNATQRRELFDRLYRKGLPWARENQTEELVDDYKPHGDAFIGYVAPEATDREVASEMAERLKKISPERFEPKEVRAYDPSEIIFYTELNAFPAYYLSEISSLKGHYESLVNDPTKKTPLHIHQDHHKFQPIMPFNPRQVAAYQGAWSLFLQALMLGLICSLRRSPDDDTRIAYQWRRKVGPFELHWTDLGPEGHAVRRLMSDATTTRQLRLDVEEQRERLRKRTGGKRAHLVALADYYYHCVFPVRGSAGGGVNQPAGSVQNLVASNLRQELRSKAADRHKIEYEVSDLLKDLASWAVPIYRDKGQVVPRTPGLRSDQRVEEWQLLGDVDNSLLELTRLGILTESRDPDGSPRMSYPRLAINWEYFEERKEAPPELGAEPPPLEPPSEKEPTFHYARDKERVGELSVADIARQIEEHPEAEHKVWAPSFGREWRDAGSVPEVAALLSPEPPPLD